MSNGAFTSESTRVYAVTAMEELYGERAWVYDAAFNWDVRDEVSWLIERFGGSPKRVLEPGCGSGRVMPAFANRGVEVVGIDRSETMLVRARQRMAAAGYPSPQLQHADMAEFEIGEQCDGGYCPINTFSYIHTDDHARRHLECVAACLPPGARYLVQLDLCNFNVYPFGLEANWDVETPDGSMRCTWSGRSFDVVTRIEVQLSRFEMVTGPNAGQTYEDLHQMRMWNWPDWNALIESSGFHQVAAHDGSRRAAAVGPSLESQQLTWHELERS